MKPLLKGGLYKEVVFAKKQGFYPNTRIFEDLIVSIFHFQFHYFLTEPTRIGKFKECQTLKS